MHQSFAVGMRPASRQKSRDFGDLGFGNLDQPQVHHLRRLGKQCAIFTGEPRRPWFGVLVAAQQDV
jgi:hypothetical protein